MGEHQKTRSIFFLPAVESCRAPLWQPRADTYRKRDGWIVKFDLAGVRPDDVSVEFDGSRLTVRGVRRDWVQREFVSYYSLEISYSRFERCIELPGDLSGARLRWEYSEGMLLVQIDK